jgi:uncharacterized protein (DUF1330 family)
MSVYILAITNITNADKYNNEFMPAIKKAHKAHNVKVVATSNAPHRMLMGEPRGNHVVILQVQDEAHARAFWNSPEAKAAMAIAPHCMSEGRIGIIPGVTELVAAPKS